MENNIKNYSPLALAFLGDAVYTLLVREHILLTANRQPAKLHTLSTGCVNAAAQAEAARAVLPLLSEEELSVFKRGRNAHPGHTPKNQSGGDYHYATGLEALFGYLYLNKEEERLLSLFDVIWQNGADKSESIG